MKEYVQLQGPSRLYGARLNLSAGRSYTVGPTGLVTVDPRAIEELLNMGFWPAPSFSPFIEDSHFLGNFSFGDATPHLVGVMNAGVYNPVARVDILTAFDGSNALLSIGTLVEPELILPQAGCYVYESAVYQSNPSLQVTQETAVYLFIQPGGGASQGSGRYWLQLI